MKSTTLVTTLTSLTKAMAVAAAVVVFGFLYVLLVLPERAAAVEARAQVEAARSELSRLRALERSPGPARAASVADEFETRAIEGDRVAEVVDAVAAARKSPVGVGISNLVIAIGDTTDGPVDSIVGPLSSKVSHTPVMVTFDAQYEQIGPFLASLRTLPATFDLRGVELAQQTASRGTLLHAKVSLLVFHRPGLTVRSGVVRPRDPITNGPTGSARPQPAPPAQQPAPVVTSIVISGGRGVALVDGEVVRPGDRLQAGVVQAIEPDAVVVAGPGGRIRRITIKKR